MAIHLRYLEQGLAIVGEIQSPLTDSSDGERRLKANQAKLNGYTNSTLPKIKEDIEEVYIIFRGCHLILISC